MSQNAIGCCPQWQDLDEAGRKEFWASLALRHCRGIGPRRQASLVRRFGSAYQALQQLDLWRTAGKHSTLAAEMASGSWRTTARREWDAARRLAAGILLWNNPLYPDCLRTLPDAPILLYCRGDVSLLRAPCLAVVGARKASEQGCRVAAHMARCLAACGISIVSGMAQGVDASAHDAALREVGRSIGVLGTGIDRIYPQRNTGLFARMEKEGGLLLSEFAPGTPPLPENFPVRNRIISGLSLGILVVEAATRSGSLITARTALEQNREVYAVPGPALDEQCCGAQELIRQGARAVFSAEDILCDLLERLRPYGIERPVLDEQALLREAAQDSSCQEAAGSGEAVSAASGSVHAPDKASSAAAGHAAVSPQRKHGRPPATGGEVLAEAGTEAPAAQPSAPVGKAAEVVRLLRQGALHVDALAERLHVRPASLAALLLELELSGQVRRLPGARYEVTS